MTSSQHSSRRRLFYRASNVALPSEQVKARRTCAPFFHPSTGPPFPLPLRGVEANVLFEPKRTIRMP